MRATQERKNSMASNKSEIAQAEKDLDTIRFIMARCTSDSAYRVYAEREKTFEKRLRELKETASAG